MTREEAERIIDTLRDGFSPVLSCGQYRALGMAIEALEWQAKIFREIEKLIIYGERSKGDQMNRKEAIHFAECLKNNWTINFNDMEPFCDMAIKALEIDGSDVISRQAAIDLIRSMESDATSHGISPRLTPSHVINGIESLPSADRPTGKWIDTEPDIPDASVRKGNKPYVCSVCGHSAGKYKYKTYKFCPWCGAEMDNGGAEQ